ncbi:Thioesterase superfamily [Neofusicoccum parvum]|uniref:Thioesterase superfamily n=1 Tax=Neofusicoccum parvum TaxID=310453 RepID=A0ACB5RXI8_9PEZI|nr:Thioesterase superfamily [Neofusicoccum parvum]GME55497.1 Thioesterase superfamily [Neofusicoccum parvum]
MATSQPTPGTTATATLVVSHGDLASTAADDNNDDSNDTGIELPAVLSTPRMIALMELAAARLLAPSLPAGHVSVGTHVAVAHTAATPLGAAVTATATLTAVEGRAYAFDVEASDAAGETGRGTHRRAVVEVARLKRGVEARAERIEKGGQGS